MATQERATQQRNMVSPHVTRRIMTRLPALVGMGLGLLPILSIAQPYPTRPIRIICPSPAATWGDVATRLAAPAMSMALGQTVLVENRPAAGGQVAAVAVKQSPADGYTTLLSTSAP